MKNIKDIRSSIPFYKLQDVYPFMPLSESLDHGLWLELQCWYGWEDNLTLDEIIMAESDLNLNAWFATLPFKHKEKLRAVHHNPLLGFKLFEAFDEESEEKNLPDAKEKPKPRISSKKETPTKKANSKK